MLWLIPRSTYWQEQVEAVAPVFEEGGILAFYKDGVLVKAYGPGSWLSVEPLKEKSAL